MTVPVLGINIDTSTAVDGVRNLDALVPAAERVERASDKMVAAILSDLKAVNEQGFARMSAAADQSLAALQRLGNSRPTQAIPSEVDRATAAYEKLRASIDPAYRASIQFAESQKVVEAALKAEIISAETAAATMAKLTAAQHGKTGIVPGQSVPDVTPQLGAAQQAMVGYGRAAQVSAGQTANLAAQFNDIGVMLAAGQSPFQLAIQQGTQVSQVLNQMGDGTSIVRGLGAAFLSMVNPVSLVTIGTIAAGSALIQYFTSADEESDKAEEALKKQASLIRDVADEWGEAVPMIRAYYDEIEAGKSRADLLQAGELLNDKIYEGARNSVEGLSSELVALRGDLELIGGPEIAPQIGNLVSAFDDLRQKVEDGTATADDARAVQEALASVMDIGGQSAVGMSNGLGVLASALESVSASAVKAQSDIAAAISQLQTFHAAEAQSRANAAAAQRYGEDFVKEQQRVNSLTREQLALETEIDRVRGAANKDGAILSQSEIEALAKDNIAADKRRADIARAEAAAARKGSGSGRKGGKSDAEKEADKAKREMEREAEARENVIEGLQFEISLLGKSDEERRIATELRKAHTDATTDEGKAIVGYITHLETAKAAQKRLAAMQEYAANTGADLFTAAIQGADNFGEAIRNVAAELGQMAAQQAFMAMFMGQGGGGGGIFGSILGSILGGGGGMPVTQSFANGTPAIYATGTSYHPGGPAIINDRGGEIVDLPTGARVYPHDVSMAMAKEARQAAPGPQQTHVTVGVEVTNDGGIRAFVKDQVTKSEKRSVRQAVGAVQRGDSSSHRFWKKP